MYLIIERDGIEANRFYDCMESFMGNLWAYSVKSGTVKKAVFTVYGNTAKAKFTLFDGLKNVDYIYCDIPVSGCLLDSYKLFNSI